MSFLSFRKLIGSILASAAFAPASPAATTDPLGIYTVKLAGKPADAPQARTYLGIQLLPDTRFVGIVSAVEGNSFQVENLGQPSVLAEAGYSFYVQVLNGLGAGFIADIVSFSDTDFVSAEALTPWMSPGNQVRIRTHPRIGDVFGNDNRFGLAAAPTSAEADNVVVWDPVNQQEKVYFYHSLHERWEERNSTGDAGNDVIRVPLGCYVVRRSAGSRWMVLSGEVSADPVLLPVRPGANVFSLPVNLSASLDQWIAGDGSHPVIAGPNANSADLLTFEEPASGNQAGPFYRRTTAGGDGWQEVGLNDASGASQRLDFLSTLVLRRHGGPGYVLATGNLEPGPVLDLPLDPEAPQLAGELPFPAAPPTGVIISVESSLDLQSWTLVTQDVSVGGGKAVFDLPAGQTRAFYRLNVTLSP
ncbi:hypothetical protein [Luteolibacter marinus]|uniref:hypothetical protein n=1 Tax=Luteolibacter marinus TaxID=2776705 RepID=UPI0018676EC1|nr:hypothetical protein [Luteolibacter marinus]